VLKGGEIGLKPPSTDGVRKERGGSERNSERSQALFGRQKQTNLERKRRPSARAGKKVVIGPKQVLNESQQKKETQKHHRRGGIAVLPKFGGGKFTRKSPGEGRSKIGLLVVKVKRDPRAWGGGGGAFKKEAGKTFLTKRRKRHAC